MPSFASKSNGPSLNHHRRHYKHFASNCPPPLNPSRHHHHHHHTPRQHQHHRTGHRNEYGNKIPLIPDEAIIGGLRDPLHLLHRARSNFFILDDITGTVYTVHLCNKSSCNCDHSREKLCMHVKFVFMQVLGVPFDDVCYKRRKLSRSTIRRLIKMPTLHEALSSFTLCLKFHKILFENTKERVSVVIEMKDGATCPVCLDEFEEEDKVVACDVCKNHIHEECYRGWKRKCLGRGIDVTCVLCRAAWCTNVTEHRINLYGKRIHKDEEDYS
ncbi:hypothetical protein RIF29_04508 [Crotalaria pallida]|uniref:SWIM-type domain-containing protein n=1 Tax=Crotalaria pallida TaxID=3830 RepID=A0AAN9J1U8_CROPI